MPNIKQIVRDTKEKKKGDLIPKKWNQDNNEANEGDGENYQKSTTGKRKKF